MKAYGIIGIAVLLTILFGCGYDDQTPMPITVVPVPDTGQTLSYTSTFGQDSDYLFHPPSYSDNGNGTITDNVTELIWQKAYNGSKQLDYEADVYCAGLTLADHSDWRVPSDFELMTIVDYGTAGPAINITYFPNTPSDSRWWTGTGPNSSSHLAGRWAVDLGSGSVDTTSLFSNGYTRCVRGGINQPHLFLDNRNGTATDRVTQLMWQKQDDGAAVVWEDAITKCEALSLGGYKDWRLPNVKELRSIVDSGTYAPALYPGCLLNPRSDSYWSSTTYLSSQDTAWRVNFWHGEVVGTLKGGALFVRCVRGGE